MYKIPKDEETKEFISASAKLLTDGGKNDEYAYDERLINEISLQRTTVFSNDCSRIRALFEEQGVFSFNSYMEWALFCIAYCFGHKAKQNPTNWDEIAPSAYDSNTNQDTNTVGRLFGKDKSFWIAFLSKQMFDYYTDTKEFEIIVFKKFISRAAHNGALLLEEKYLDLQKTYKDEPYKAVSQFLLDLAELAGRNVPPPPPKPPIGGDEQPPDPPQNKTNADKSKDILNALEKCKIPAESVIFSAEGMRYDIYEVKLKEPYILSNKDIEKISQSLWGKDILGESVKGKSLTLNIKILKPENEWKVFEDNEFQRALQEYKDNFELPICLGLDELGKPVFEDYYNAPHSIIGGTTGSGKSVLLRAMLESLFELNPSPEKLQIAIIDGKNGADFVDFEKKENLYESKIFTPNGTDYSEIIEVLDKLTEKLLDRKDSFSSLNVKKITDLSEEQRPPFIVIVLDELENILANYPKLGNIISQFSKIGRSYGFLLLLSTQNPSKNAIGDIPTNTPTRIALKTTSHTESQIILGESGAEKIIGKGDHFVRWNGREKVFLHGYNLKG